MRARCGAASCRPGFRSVTARGEQREGRIVISTVTICENCRERVTVCERCGETFRGGDLSTCGILAGGMYHAHLETEKCASLRAARTKLSAPAAK